MARWRGSISAAMPLLWGIGFSALAVALQMAIRPWAGDRSPFLFFLPALTIVAMLHGRGAAFIVLLVGASNKAYWAPPAGSFALDRSEDIVALGAFLGLGAFLIWYGSRVHTTSARAALAEGRLALAQEGTGVGVFELDFAKQSAFVSPALCHLIGQPVMPGPMPLRRWLAALDPDHVDSSLDALTAHAERGELFYEREQRIERKDGGVCWLLHRVRLELGPTGKLATARGTSVDITSRKCAEIALQELNAGLERMVRERTRERDGAWNNAQDLLVVVDATGTFRATNPAWETVLGYRSDELIGHRGAEFIHADDLAASKAALARAAVRRLPRFENRYRHKDGTFRWISWVASPDAELIYASGRDVTIDRKTAEELEAAHEQLRQSQKMEAIGQLTGGVAHDFNNLLQVIGGNLQLLSKETAGNEGASRRVSKALAATQRGAKLANHMLAFSRRQPLDPKVVNVGRLATAMDDLLRRALGGAIEIETVVPAGLWNTRVDPVQLENAILNLAINARDAMNRAGKLTIALSNGVLDDGDPARPGAGPTEFVIVALSDTGCGMPPDVAAKVFEPFFSTKPVGQGTGLGLSMVHGFVTQSGGHLRLHSVVGQGTTITLFLPRSDEPEGAETVADAVRPQRGSGTVLLADDDEAVREVVLEMLGGLGYHVLTACNAAHALEILRNGANVDLLLTDVVMPGEITSVELARQAEAICPGLAILFTSGYMPEDVLADDHFADARELLAKPFSREELASKVNRAIDARRVRQAAGTAPALLLKRDLA